MDENGWLGCESPAQLWHYAEMVRTPKKQKWFYQIVTCLCARAGWKELGKDQRQLIDSLELLAAGLFDQVRFDTLRLKAVRKPYPYEIEAHQRRTQHGRPPELTLLDILRVVTANPTKGLQGGAAFTVKWYYDEKDREVLERGVMDWLTRHFPDHASIESRQITLDLYDVFGNPFRPVVFSPAWRTDTAVVLARQMYKDREFGAMPILADALQDAGCDSDDILSHCRDANQVHVRGCWAVDLVLGKV